MAESMPVWEIAWRLGAGLVLIAANAFFVAVEFGLTRLRQLDLTEEDLESSPGLRRAWEMTDRLEIHLTGCQLGISSSSVVLGVVAEPAVTAVIAPVIGLVGIEGASVRAVSVAVAIVALNLVHKIWGEQAPTYLGVERPRAVVERLAPALYWWTRIMHPLIKLGDGLAKATLRPFGVEITRSWTEDGGGDAEGDDGNAPIGERSDLKRRMADLLSRGRVPEDRRQEVLASLEIDEIPARRVMVPLDDLVHLALDAPGDENRRRIARSGYVRYPVLEAGGEPGRADRVAGVVYVPALFDPPERLAGPGLDLEDLLHPPVFLDPDLPVSELIDRLQAERQEAAFLVEKERVVGMVTIMDALEAIAGPSEDPLDDSSASGR